MRSSFPTGSYLPTYQQIPAQMPQSPLIWPSYDATGTDGGSSAWLFIANPGQNSVQLAVLVYSGANVTSTIPATIAPRSLGRLQLPGVAAGPVLVQASAPVVGVMALYFGHVPVFEGPAPGVSQSWYFPTCLPRPDPSLGHCVVFVAAPPSNSATANVSVQSLGTGAYSALSVAPGGMARVDLGTGSAPVLVSSDQPVVAGKAYQSSPVSGLSFLNQVEGIPFLATQVSWAAFDSTLGKPSPSGYIAVLNPPSASGAATIQVSTANYLLISPPLPPGQAFYLQLPDASLPAVSLSSNIPVAAEEVEGSLYQIQETPALAPATTQYVPLYDSQDSPGATYSSLVLANPGPSAATVQVAWPNGSTSQMVVAPRALASLSGPGSSVIGPLAVSATSPVVVAVRMVPGYPPPSVSSINPTLGSVTGGTQVTLTGSFFYWPLAVYFGQTPSTSVQVLSPTTAIATAPPAAATGPVTVTVSTIMGTSTPGPYSVFTYANGLSVFHSGSFGYDFSWPQCPSNFPPAGAAFYIVGADYGRPFSRNPCFVQELSYTGGNYNLYAVIFWNGQTSYATAPLNCSQASNKNACYAYDWGYNAAAYAFESALAAGFTSPVWWLDIEGPAGSSNPLWSTDLASNAFAVQGAIDFFSSQPVPGVPGARTVVGIYSAPCIWPEIVGGYNSLSGCRGYLGYSPGVPEWIADWNSPSNPSIYCDSSYSFTGGPIEVVQYSDNAGGFDGDYAC